MKLKQKATTIRHKFQTFQQRIDNISVDVVKKTRFKHDPGESHSFFKEALGNLFDLNIEELKRMRYDFDHLDLAQLLLAKENVVDRLITLLTSKNPTVAFHTLNLVSSLARDLQGELYGWFDRFFTAIKGAIDEFHQNTEVLEHCFTSLSYLIYYAKDKARDDVESIIKISQPLLCSPKQYLQHFMAESLAFLIRKAPNHKRLFVYICTTCGEKPEMTSACGHILAETLRGVRHPDSGGKLHSLADRLLPAMLEVLTSFADDADMMGTVSAALRHAYDILMAHCSARHADLLWRIPARALTSTSGTIVFNPLCDLVSELVQFRHGCLVTTKCAEELLEVLMENISCMDSPNLRRLMALTLVQSKTTEKRFLFLRKLFVVEDSLPTRLLLVEEAVILEDDEVRCLVCLQLLPLGVLIRDMTDHLRGPLLRALLILAENGEELDFSKLPKKNAMSQMLSGRLDRCEDENDALSCLQLLNHVTPLDQDALLPVLPKLVASFLPEHKVVDVSELTESRLLIVLHLTQLATHLEAVDRSAVPLVRLLRRCRAACALVDERVELAAGALELHLEKWTPRRALPPKLVGAVMERLSERLLSARHEMRRVTLRCLLHLWRLVEEGRQRAVVLHVLESGIAVEEVHPVGLHNFRDAARLTGELSGTRLLHQVREGEKEPEDEEGKKKEEKEVECAVDLAIKLLLGRLWINFRELWRDTIATLVSLAQSCGAKFWKELLPRIFKHTDACSGEDVTHEMESYLALLWRTAGAVPVQSVMFSARQALAMKMIDFFESSYSKLHSVKNRKLIVEMLTMLSKYDNLSHVDLSNRLDELFHRLLCDHNEDVQQAALLCVASYHRRKIRLYTEPLSAILAKGGLQAGLLKFKLNDEDTVVPAHRKIVGDVLLRILYGKMQHRAGDRNRALLVFAYMGECCDEREMNYFLELVFHHFRDMVTRQVEQRENVDGLQELVKAHAGELFRDLNARTAGLMQGTCRTLLLLLDSIYFQRVAAHAPLFFQLLLTVVETIGQYRRSQQSDETEAMETDEEKAEVEDGPHIKLSQFRGLRQSAVDLLLHFLASFSDYAWTEAELQALRAVAVAPQLPRLHHEGLNAPGLCLHLLSAWSAAPRFLVLLEGEGEQDAVGAVLRLMSHGKAAETVVDKCLCVMRNLIEEDSQPRGLVLLRPHIPALLTFLSGRVAALSATRLEGELRLLTALSPYLSDPDTCLSLVNTLCKHAHRLCDNRCDEAVEQALVNLLRSTDALLVQLPPSPQRLSVLRRLHQLFSRMQGRAARQALVELVSREDAGLGKLVAALNSWDRVRVEARDFERRQKALAAGAEAEGDALVVTVHCAVHDLVHDAEMRGVVCDFLEGIIPALKDDTLLTGVIWPAVKTGLLRDSDQMDLQRLLRLVAKLGETGHPRLRGIAVLAAACQDEYQEGKGTPVRLSLWEGLSSFNLGRNIQAMKLVGNALMDSELDVPQEILTDVVLRLVWTFLDRRAAYKRDAMDERANQRMNNFGTVAAGLLETVARRLTWHPYKLLLKRALRNLDNATGGQAALSGIESAKNRMLVNFIVCVLDGFHFLEEFPNQQTLPPPPEKIEDGEEDEEQSSNRQKSSEASIREYLAHQVLPRLERHIARRHSLEERHKLAQKTPKTEEESLEVPIALAVVKLAKFLDTQTMEMKLRKVFYRVCQFLRSPRYSTRVEAGATLVKILVSLGLPFFHFMLREMTLCLSRGFQRHVLVLTVFHLLKGMSEKEALHNGCFNDAVVNQIMDLCFDDMFGELSEEKKVEAITKKLPEAKKSKALDIMRLLVAFLDAHQLDTFFKRLKEESFKLRKKEPLKRFEAILSALQSRDAILSNSAATPSTLLILIHHMLADCLPQMRQTEEEQLHAKRRAASADLRSEETSENPWDARPDSLLLEAEPKCAKPVELKVSKTNTHLLVDFSLRLLLHLLKAPTSNYEEIAPMLAPLLPTIVVGLDSQHNRVVVGALRCLHCLQQQRQARELLSSSVEAAAVHAVFRLLNQRARFGGAGSVETVELLTTLFKVAAAFVTESDAVTKSDMELMTDLVHAELMAMRSGNSNSHRVATTFTLLRAIVHRKNKQGGKEDMVVTLEGTHKHASFQDVIKLLRDVCITHEMEHVREQGRLCLAARLSSRRITWHELERHVQFFCDQLHYMMAPGRVSALLLLESIFKSLPAQQSLRRTKRLELFFCSLVLNLGREASVDESVIAHYQDTIRAILSALTASGSQPEIARSMWQQTKTYINADPLFVRLTGLRVATAFLPVDEDHDPYISLTIELPQVLVEAGERLIAEENGKASTNGEKNGENGETNVEENGETTVAQKNGKRQDNAETTPADRVADMVVTLLHKLENDSLEGYNLLENLLRHRCPSVREKALHRFAVLPLVHPYFAQAQETGSRVATLVYRLFDQLKSSVVTEAWCDVIVKVMVRVAEACLKPENEQATRPLTVDWLLHRWNREAVHETQHMRKCTVRRCGALKFTAAVVKVTNDQTDRINIQHIAKMLGREQRQLDRHTDESLKTLIEDSHKMLSKHFGQRLTQAMAEEAKEKRLLKRKKEQMAELAITDSATFAAKKMKKNRKTE